MAGRQVDEARLLAFARLVSGGVSLNAASKEVGIGYSTVMRQLGDPGSRLNLFLNDLGSSVGGVPGRVRYSSDALRALEDFDFFRSYFFARASNPWAQEAAEKILELLASPNKEYLVVNIAPGVGKSTMFAHDLPAWLACRDRATTQMIGSSSQKLANGYTRRLKNSFERLTPVKADPELVALGLAQDAKSTLTQAYGRFKPKDGVWQVSEFVLEQPGGVAVDGKESSFVAWGRDSEYLGGRYKNVVWDDLVTHETLRTEEARLKLIQSWKDAAESRLEPSGLLILQGQRLASNDLYRYCLDLLDHTEIDMPPDQQPKKYHHIVFKAHYDDRCEGLHKPTDPAYPEGCLLDPYRLQFRDLMRVKTNDENGYRILYQQEDADPGNSLVQRVWIDGGTLGNQYFPGCWDENRSAGNVPNGVTGYSVITADPSPTKFWSIGWWIYDPQNENQHLLDMERAPMDAPDFLDWNHADQKFTGLLEDWYLRSLDKGRPLTHLIVESNAAQRFMLQYEHFRRWMAYRGVEVVAHQTTRNKSDEDYGVQTIAPHYKYGRVRLPGNRLDGSRNRIEPLVKEVCSWPNGSTDDCVMMHWFLIWNAPTLFPKPRHAPLSFNNTPSWMAASRGLRTG